MAAYTNFLENKMIDHVWRGQTYVFPADFHFGLFTGAPNEAGGGTEVTGGSYARVAVTRSLANFAGTQGAGTTAVSSGTGGVTSNNAPIVFPTATADWGLATHVGVFDAPTGGNLLKYAPLNTPRNIVSTVTPVYAAGALTFTEDA